MAERGKEREGEEGKERKETERGPRKGLGLEQDGGQGKLQWRLGDWGISLNLIREWDL